MDATRVRVYLDDGCDNEAGPVCQTSIELTHSMVEATTEIFSFITKLSFVNRSRMSVRRSVIVWMREWAIHERNDAGQCYNLDESVCVGRVDDPHTDGEVCDPLTLGASPDVSPIRIYSWASFLRRRGTGTSSRSIES